MTGLTAAGGGQIFDPQGERVLGLAQSTAAERLIPDQTGFYEIRGNDGVRWLAVNVDARESDLTPLPRDLRAALAGDAVRAGRAANVAGRSRARGGSPKPRSLGPLLLWLAAALLLAELLLANRYLAIRRGECRNDARVSDSKLTWTRCGAGCAHISMRAPRPSPWRGILAITCVDCLAAAARGVRARDYVVRPRRDRRAAAVRRCSVAVACRCVGCVAIDGAQIFEQRLPDEGGRIQTYLDGERREAQGRGLAADRVCWRPMRPTIAERTPARRDRLLAAHRGAACWSLSLRSRCSPGRCSSLGPAYWGFGSRHLLLGAELPRNAVPVRSVTVDAGQRDRPSQQRPGDSRRGRRLPSARGAGVRALRRSAGVGAGADAGRRRRSDSRFEFRLYAVRGPLQYYVDAEGTRSAEHNVAVVDLPRIERVRLTYYVSGVDRARRQTSTKRSRDIRAVAGTNVKVEVFADAPLEAPALIVDGTDRRARAAGSHAAPARSWSRSPAAIRSARASRTSSWR